MAVKYQEYFKLMIEQNQSLFDEFRPVHDGYKENRKQFSQRFHQEGQKVVDVIRDWDRRLCASQGKGAFSQYTQKLSEKFWGRVRQDFPLIDLVGVKSNLD